MCWRINAVVAAKKEKQTMKGKETATAIISMLYSFDRFTDNMATKLIDNIPEKDTSFRVMDDAELKNLIAKYLKRKDYTSVANIAFMLSENNGEI